MKLIDTHTHIDFFDDPQNILNNYNDLSILTIFMTYLPEIFEQHLESFSIYKNIRLALGYHPSMTLNYEFKKNIFIKNMKKTNYIGEIGLDYSISKDLRIIKKQKEVFDYITKKTNVGKILSIHSRNAEKDVLEILKKNKVRHAIFHWYSGPLGLIDEIIENGYYFSINVQMMNSQKGQKILKRIPKEYLLFETDAPFTKYEKEITQPEHIGQIYKELSFFFDETEIEEIFFNNFLRLLRNRQNDDNEKK